MKRGIAVLVCVAMLGTTVLSGCETYGGSAGVGAGTGALAGGIIGHQRGRALEGAAIGAAIGAVADLIVHEEVHRRKTRQETVQTYGYVPAQGLFLQFERAEVLPRDVRPGEEVETTIQYALLGTPPGGIPVREVRTLLRGDRLVSELSSKTETRDDGTWVSAQRIRLPSDLVPGFYVLYTRVTAGDHEISGRADFTVR